MTHSPSSAQSGLLPCPFCGPGESVVDLWHDDVAHRWRVGCGRCGCSTGIHPRDKSQEPAITAWNRRAAASAHTIGEDAANVAIGEREAHCVNTCNFYNKNRPCECPAPQSDAAAWEAIFDRVAVELNCLPSSSPDGNEHVFHAIAKLRAALTAEKVAGPVAVYPQGVMGIPPYSPPGSGSVTVEPGISRNAAPQQPAQPVAQTLALTDEQMMTAIKSVCGFDADKAEQWRPEALAIGRAVERALLAAQPVSGGKS